MAARVPHTLWHPIDRIQHGRRPATVGVVVHDMESDSLDGVENYFRTSSPDGVGAHLGIGKTGESRQWADLEAICYHAPGGNRDRIGIEQEGFASFSRAKWLARPRQLRALANRIGYICWRYKLGIPHHGTNVVGHYQLPAGGHSDPGPYFPWDDGKSKRGAVVTRGLMYLSRRAYRKLVRTNGKHWI